LYGVAFPVALFGFLGAVAQAQVSAPGTVPAAVQQLAQRTTARVVKTRAQRILLAPRASCLLDETRCAELDSVLRTTLAKSIPNAHLMGREDIVPVLKAQGLMTIDAYFLDVLQFFALDTGADILLTESLVTSKRGYELWVRVFDTSSRKELTILKSEDFRPLPTLDEEPLVVQDMETGVSLVLPRGMQRAYPDTRLPECDYCPDFSYDSDSRWVGTVVIVGTVNTQGKAVDMKVLRGFGTENSAAVLKAHGELNRYKPAIGVDGSPFPVRQVFTATFK
jgi:hypothetical protein